MSIMDWCLDLSVAVETAFGAYGKACESSEA